MELAIYLMMLVTFCLKDIRDILSVTNRHFHVNKNKISKAAEEIWIESQAFINREYSPQTVFSDVWLKLNSQWRIDTLLKTTTLCSVYI